MDTSHNFSPERFLHFVNGPEKYDSETLVSDFIGVYATKKITSPVPYTPEFLEELEKYLLKPGNAEKQGITDISGWLQKLRLSCQKDYKAWKQARNTDRVSSYFVAVEGQSGFIGELKTQYDVMISPNNIVGIGSAYLHDCIKESLNLVKYYLMTSHQIPEEWLSITAHISLDWKKSLLQEFSTLDASSGESFCFLFCALFYASILRKLASDGRIEIFQEGKCLKAEEIRIPQDILLTGSFDFGKVPDTSIRQLEYQSIPAKPVDAIWVKEKTANSINQLEPDTIKRFVIPSESLAEKDKATPGIDRIEVANAEEFFQSIFPYRIMPCQKLALFGKMQGEKIFYATSMFLIVFFCFFLYFISFTEIKIVQKSEILAFYEYENPILKEISPNSVINSHKQYKLKLTIPDKEQYVYIWQADGQKIQPVFPHPDPEIKNMAEAREYWYEFTNPMKVGEYWIPPKKESLFSLDEIAGTEQFIVIHSSKAVTGEKQAELAKHYLQPKKGYRFSSEKMPKQEISIKVYGYEHRP